MVKGVAHEAEAPPSPVEPLAAEFPEEAELLSLGMREGATARLQKKNATSTQAHARNPIEPHWVTK